MSNETKRNVLEDLVEELADAYIALDGEGIGEDLTNEEKQAYLKDYDAVLPDDLPVIPKAVGDAIKIHKDYAHSLLDIFGALSIYGVSRTEPSLDYNAWIVHHPDDFARAWVLGAWCVEETGEIVKLEADD